jgi:hypothetical protein
MNVLCALRRAAGPLGALAVLALACAPSGRLAARAPAPIHVKTKTTEIGKNVFLEVQGAERRVVVKSVVVLREGPLEGLLTRHMTKEHEYILATDSDARHIHLALTLARAAPGSPVVLAPRFAAAHGDAIRVSLRYKKGGKLVTVPARDWVRDNQGKQPLAHDWVFGGSRFVPDPRPGKPPYYVANQGDLICLCNMDSAMLDLPVYSPKSMGTRFYEAHTERVPPVKTPVDVVLEPVPGRKGRK